MKVSERGAVAPDPTFQNFAMTDAKPSSAPHARASSTGARVVVSAFEGSPEALQQHLRTLSPDLTVQPASSARTMKVSSRFLVTKGVRLWRNAYEASARMSCEQAPDDLVLFTPTRGGFQALTRDEHQAKPGEMLCLYPPPPGAWVIPAASMIEGMAIPRDLVTSRLRARLGGRLHQELAFKPVLDTQTCAVRSVRLAAQALMTATEHNELDLEGGVIQSLSAALIDLVLEMLPNSYSESLRRPAPRISPRQVRRAVAYIHDNPVPTKTTDELAEICGVSARSLQYAFRDFVGMAPAEYWRKVRLDRAMDQLRKDPSRSISSIAAEWGFTNVTRFRALAGLDHAAAGLG